MEEEKKAEYSLDPRDERSVAIDIARAWVEKGIMAYEEPIRTRRYRGDKGGFPKKKTRAAWWTVIYPTLDFQEIAAEAGVSRDQLYQWRREPAFSEEAERACDRFGKTFATTIEIIVELKRHGDPAESYFFSEEDAKVMVVELKTAEGVDCPVKLFPKILGRLIPFFDIKIQTVLTDFLNKKMQVQPEKYFPVIMGLASSSGYDFKTLQQWMPKFLEEWRDRMKATIDRLNDPRWREQTGPQETEKLAGLLKDWVGALFASLAK
jgi:hypothetical protein